MTRRLGLLLPSSGTVQEVDFYRRVPPDVTVHSARMRLTEATVDDDVGNEVKAARRLRTRHVVRAGRRVGTPSSPSDLVA